MANEPQIHKSDCVGDSLPVISPMPFDLTGSYFKRVVHWLCFTRQWVFDEPWCFMLYNGDIIVIPKGFCFDGASVPKLFRSLLSPTGILFIPGIIHDYAYTYDQLIGVKWDIDNKSHFYDYHKGAGKLFWDYLFKRTADRSTKFYIIPTLTYSALFCFGFVAWCKHRIQDKQDNVHV